jgi:hypothetical protein
VAPDGATEQRQGRANGGSSSHPRIIVRAGHAPAAWQHVGLALARALSGCVNL